MQASSRAQIAPFLAMDVLNEANQLEAAGRRILHLETGQPGGRAPQIALDAVRQALIDDNLGYTEALGRPALKSAIAERYRAQYGLDVDPRRVIVTTGSSAGFVLSFLALFEPGQGLAMATPGYPAYRNTALALNVTPIAVNSGAGAGFHLPAQSLRETANASGLLIASPANPTGTVIHKQEMETLASICMERRWPLISDEIYHGLVYGAPAPTALSVAPDAIVINSFSKYFAMTGWRIGWMIVPEALVRPIERLAQNLFISPPAISQVAALAALSPAARPELEDRLLAYRRNRDVLTSALWDSGVKRIAPADGAFYLYVNCESTRLDSRDVAKRLLHETGVAVTPGWDFDPDEGGAWIRLSYAGSEKDVSEAAEILKAWFRRG